MRRGPGARRLFLTIAAICILSGLAGGSWSCGAPSDDRQSLPEGTEVTLRNHREIATGDGAAETVRPRFLGGRNPSVCLQVPAGVDASQWQATLRLEALRDGGYQALDSGEPGEPRAPTAHSGDVLCFEAPWPAALVPPADLRLCGTVVDLYDDSRFELPCRDLRFEEDDGTRAALMEEANAAVSDRKEVYFGEFLDRLGAVAHQARGAGFPGLGLRVELIAVHYILQEGEIETLPRAERLLRRLPPWIDHPAATALAADSAYLAGVLRYQRRDELELGWQELQRAESLYRRILDRKRLAAVRGQVEILARVGAIREALLRLEHGLEDCRQEAPCSDVQRFDARGQHAWLTLVDSDASAEELEAAAADLEDLQAQPSLEPQERANHLVNLALLQARQGREPSAALEQAAELAALDGGDRDTPREELLVGWSRMAEALYELSREDGDLQRAEQRCRELSRGTPSPRLDAWSFSCLGRLYRRQGRLDAATRAFDQALGLHHQAPALDLGRLLPLGPGERANDHYRAARLALERGDAERAWEVLASLDRAPGTGSPDSISPDSTSPDSISPDSTSLDSTDGTRNRAAERDGDRYRAFALDDEILLLLRRPSSAPVLVRRTELPEGDLRQRTDAIQTALAERRLDDDDWRELVAPLAEALWPAAGSSGGSSVVSAPGETGSDGVTFYALHGLLQRVPLAALPAPPALPPSPEAPHWLADVTVPAVQPAGAPVPSLAASPSTSATERKPVVVLDPLENLGARREQAELYGEIFPDNRTLVGREATVAAFREHLPRASWLHVDAHGTYDPAFPERSRLELADGAITLGELAELPTALSFANLSGCQTGRWPVTADSGRYGIGGLLAQQGRGWVIASRADLLDSVARTFNPRFYRALDGGAEIPEAYRQALDAVRAGSPAVTWASIFLLHGPIDAGG